MLGTGPAHDLRIRTRSPVSFDNPLESLPGILIDDARGAGPPSSVGVDANSRIRLEIAYVVGLSAVLGHQPEHVTVEAVCDWRHARDSTLAAERFDQRRAAALDPQTDGCAGDAIDQPHRRALCQRCLRPIPARAIRFRSGQKETYRNGTRHLEA